MTLIRQWLNIVVLGVLGAYVILALALKIPIVNDAIKQVIENGVSKSNRIQLSIGSLQGSIFSVINVNDIRLKLDGSRAATIDIESMDIMISMPRLLLFQDGIIRQMAISTVNIQGNLPVYLPGSNLNANFKGAKIDQNTVLSRQVAILLGRSSININHIVGELSLDHGLDNGETVIVGNGMANIQFNKHTVANIAVSP